MTPFAWVVSLPVRFYRIVFSPWVGHACRFQPTCSAYAMDALERHGALKGSWLAARRIGRCHPWGSSGYDPVPAPQADQKTRPDCDER
ncbi:hypothetical protein LY56_02667 [Roseinatronobacter thiooxidans]|uniref:Putative membrane protein insertion efficiency factor n=1 Tax=Roseinatronobacter thiooxidans TaxID=121821 RepID=A0A2W7Q0B3_9RHOB|nr:membrane protein insertion efficiency factor YidD [Roseinatronobacter thiooxidans]PZX39500.1 hypothetical protein LY56_02667 [Roseinatronobacter thiooxidans]